MEAKRSTEQPHVGPPRAEQPARLQGASRDSRCSEHCGSVSHPSQPQTASLGLRPLQPQRAQRGAPEWGARSPSSFQTHKCAGSAKQLGFKARLIRLQLHLRGSPPRGRLQPSSGIITEQQRPGGPPNAQVSSFLSQTPIRTAPGCPAPCPRLSGFTDLCLTPGVHG